MKHITKPIPTFKQYEELHSPENDHWAEINPYTSSKLARELSPERDGILSLGAGNQWQEQAGSTPDLSRRAFVHQHESRQFRQNRQPYHRRLSPQELQTKIIRQTYRCTPAWNVTPRHRTEAQVARRYGVPLAKFEAWRFHRPSFPPADVTIDIRQVLRTMGWRPSSPRELDAIDRKRLPGAMTYDRQFKYLVGCQSYSAVTAKAMLANYETDFRFADELRFWNVDHLTQWERGLEVRRAATLCAPEAKDLTWDKKPAPEQPATPATKLPRRPWSTPVVEELELEHA